ncbi:unnamed protein product [Oikopleura dioica]|uniref:Uncharacterized protein n=1 Tax=Oikopleura dioica TaxID=34765 RepID=E4XP08_OIKDI|nr:unnamed protein product [Oikopleura dioica]
MYPAGASAEEKRHIRLQLRASRLGGTYNRETGEIAFPDSFDFNALPAGFFSSTPAYLFSDESDSEGAPESATPTPGPSSSSGALPPPLPREKNAYRPRTSSGSEDSETEVRLLLRELDMRPAPSPAEPGFQRFLADRAAGVPAAIPRRDVVVVPTHYPPGSVPPFDAKVDRYPRHFNGTFRMVHAPSYYTDGGCLPRRTGPGVVQYPVEPDSRLGYEISRNLGTPQQSHEHGIYLPGQSPDTGDHFSKRHISPPAALLLGSVQTLALPHFPPVTVLEGAASVPEASNTSALSSHALPGLLARYHLLGKNVTTLR